MTMVLKNRPYDWAKEDWTLEDHILDAMLTPISSEEHDGWTTLRYAGGGVLVVGPHGELDLGVVPAQDKPLD